MTEFDEKNDFNSGINNAVPNFSPNSIVNSLPESTSDSVFSPMSDSMRSLESDSIANSTPVSSSASIPTSNISASNEFPTGDANLGGTVPLNMPDRNISFAGAIGRFFKKYGKFTGRASQREYWFAVIFELLIVVFLLVALFSSALSILGDTVLFAHFDPDNLNISGSGLGLFIFVGFFCIAVFFALVIPTFAVLARRAHDANLPGAVIFIPIVLNILNSVITNLDGKSFSGLFTLLSFVFYITVGILPPKKEGNRFDNSF